MNKDVIHKNGLLELYLLGELNTSEQIQVERAINSDASLKADFEKLESNFEALALENAILPPKQVREDVLNLVSQQKVIPIKKSNSSKTYLAIAASFAGLLLISTLWLFNQFNNIQDELQTVQQQNATLQDDLNELNSNFALTTKWFNAINSVDARQYILAGNNLSPDAKVISYVNDKEKSVVINTEQLPKLPEDKDYQMWADVNGVMIDMGVISKTETLAEMSYIDNAESLNITIEPAGGNDHPTVSQLISNVYLD